MMGVTIPPADIYGYLDDSDAPGTILEDEAQGLQKDTDKGENLQSRIQKRRGRPKNRHAAEQTFHQVLPRFQLQSMRRRRNPKSQGFNGTIYPNSHDGGISKEGLGRL